MTTLPDPARALQTRIRDQIPLVHAMDLRIHAWSGDALTMAAPLKPNINDKGCAFGGSLASVMTIAGWALVVLALEQRGLDCDVFVARSEAAYRAPVWNDFLAHAELDPDADRDRFFTTLARRGKARVALRCHVHEADGDTLCATLAAQFVAKTRDPAHGTTSIEKAP
ncbi:MAG TPA: YiiD C-terminal domain-containing protein [Oleiagrimonas sp.]|nr:YiiD C-terminal domain-containing protein [Oleiagrimonas sp.]